MSSIFNCIGAIGLRGSLFSNNNPPIAGLSDIACTGKETRLGDCPSVRVSDNRCETVSAVCQGKQNVGF